MIDSEVRNVNSLLRKSRNERSRFIVENTSQLPKQSKAQDCPSRIDACDRFSWQTKPSFAAAIPSSWIWWISDTFTTLIYISHSLLPFWSAHITSAHTILLEVSQGDHGTGTQLNALCWCARSRSTEVLSFCQARCHQMSHEKTKECNRYSDKSQALFDDF